MKSSTATPRGTVAVFQNRILWAVCLIAALLLVGCRSGLPETTSADTSVAPTAQPQSPGDSSTPAVDTVDGGTNAGGDSGSSSTGNTPTDTGGTTNSGDATGGDTASGGDTSGDTTAGDTAGDTTSGGTTGGDTKPSLPVTGSITLSWRAPSERADGTPLALSELGGYRIYYGSAAAPTSNKVVVSDASVTVYQLNNLPGGTYVVAVSAVDQQGGESALSNAMSKTIQ